VPDRRDPVIHGASGGEQEAMSYDRTSAADLDDAWRRRWQYEPCETMAAVVRDHRRAIYSKARQICGEDRAADVVQEVYLRLWQHPDRYQPSKGPLGPFLTMVTTGIAIDVVRRDARRRSRDEHVHRLAEVGVIDPAEAVDPVTDDRVRDALLDLDHRQRDAVVASVVEELVHREIAALRGIPEGTVKSRVRTGLHHMRIQLRDLSGTPGDLSCT
jgi:RNA polymerase sigma-70 factor, ECF subfamily